MCPEDEKRDAFKPPEWLTRMVNEGALGNKSRKGFYQRTKDADGKRVTLVRDLATACHKSVRIEMEGRETDLDRTIIEAIRDPLTHLIRNAVDHGIEAPADRLANGKPEEGTIQLRAYHEGGHALLGAIMEEYDLVNKISIPHSINF